MKQLGTRILGSKGEKEAETFLRGQGLKWIVSNWRTKWGEIDLIMKDGETLVFIEVKTRREKNFGEPEDAVTSLKKSHFMKSAMSYVQKTGQEDKPIRFDVVSIGPSGIRHFPDALQGDSYYYY